MSRVSIVVAAAESGVIGRGGMLPWHLPADLAHFKRLTMGHPIIMGRVTHESIGKALPGRRNIIITSASGYKAEDCEVVASLDGALALVKGEEEVFIIGGASVYEQAKPKANRIYLTQIHAKVDGDRFFKYNPEEWKVISKESHQPGNKNLYGHDFLVLTRV